MEMSLKDLFRVFKRFIWIILALAIIGAVCSGLYTRIFVGAQFNSTSKVQWKKGVEIKTCIENVKGDALADATVKSISDRYTLSAEQIKGMVCAQKVGETNVISITVSHADSGTAYYVCNALTQNMVTVFEGMGATVSVLNLPSESPAYENNFVRNTIIGGVVGAIVGLVVALVLYRIFKTIYNRSDIEKCFDISVLGAVSIKNKENALELLGVNALDTAFVAESKKIAVVGVGNEKVCKPFNKFINKVIGKGCDSACESGKDLALALAGLGKKTLYIDARLSKGNTSVFGVEFESGLSDYLIGETELVAKACEINNLSVIGAGSKIENSVQVLSSDKMKEVLNKLAVQFECIVLDMSSVALCADAPAVHGAVDGYVLAVKAGGNSITQVNNALCTLSQLSTTVHGVILDNAKSYDVFGGRVLTSK